MDVSKMIHRLKTYQNGVHGDFFLEVTDLLTSLITEKEPSAQSPAAMAGYAPFKPPFKYDEMGNYIFDSVGNMIVDVRGWGFLTGKGAMAYDQEKAMKIQDSIGHRIAQIMTEDAGV